MKKTKCYLSLLMALIMLCSAPSAAALAAETTNAVQDAASATISGDEAEDQKESEKKESLDTAEEVSAEAAGGTAKEEPSETAFEDLAEEDPADANAAALTGEQDGEQAGDQDGEQAGDQTGEQAGNQDGEQAGNQTGEQAGDQNGEQAGDQTDEQDGTDELQSSEDGESTIVTLTNSKTGVDFEATARFDASVYPEARTLYAREEGSDEVEPIAEEIRQLVDGYEDWEVDDIRSVRGFFVLFYDSDDKIFNSAERSPVEYTFTFPEEYMPTDQTPADLTPTDQTSAEQTPAEYTYYVYNPTINGPVLMEDAVVDVNARTISITRENANPFEFEVVFLSKTDPITAPAFQDCESAISYVREQAVCRENNIDIHVPDEVYQQLDMDGMMDVLAHTGIPWEGDYLANSIAFKSVSAEQLKDSSWLVSYYFAYWDTFEETQAVNTEVAELVSSLDLVSGNLSVYDRIKAIYDYITSHVTYANEALSQENPSPSVFSAYGSFIEQHCVCQGYALMFYRLALEAGIDCRIITGTVDNGDGNPEGHAWNIVLLDDKYYLLDTTWDAGKTEYSYFLYGRNDFGHANDDDQFHTVAGFSEAYPLADEKYGFTIKSLGKAPDHWMITLDNKVITTAAKNGRAKAIIFFDDDCVYSTALLNRISRKEYPGVDIIAADFNGSSRTRSLIGTILPASIPGFYTCCTSVYDTMHEMEDMTGIRDEDWDSSPTLFLIDKNNQIIFAQHGDCNNQFEYILEHYLVDPDAPAYKGDTTNYGSFQSMGLCGDRAVWRYYKNGTLRISGTGPLWDNINWPSKIGWYNDAEEIYVTGAKNDSCQLLYYKDIKRVIVEKGITSIGGYMFASASKLVSIEIPATVKKIGISGYGPFYSSDVIIYGYGNSAAKTYADKNGHKYVDLNKTSSNIDYYAGATTGTGSTANSDTYLPKVAEPGVFTLLTTDNREIKTKAENGRGKVFVFYNVGVNCDGTPVYEGIPDSFFTGLEQSPVTYADVVLVPVAVFGSGMPLAKKQIGSKYPSSFPGVYCVSSNNTRFFETLQEPYDLDYTSTVIMDGNSKIVYAQNGIPENLSELVNTLVTAPGSSSGSAAATNYGSFVKSGICGNQAVWHFYSDGTLRISGKGNLWDNIGYPTSIGWVESSDEDLDRVDDYILNSKVKRVIVDSGIKYIGQGMFTAMKNLTSVVIPSSVVLMPSSSYYGVADSGKVTFYITENSYAHKYAKANGFKYADPSCVIVAASASIVAGKTKSLNAVGVGKLTYSSSNTKVATVSSKGVVKAIKPGTATITVKAAGNSTYKAVSKKVKISVYKCVTPTIASLQSVTGGVKISWKTVSGAAKYRVFRKTGSGSWTKVGDTTALSLVDKTAKNGTKYTYTVRCISSDGKSYTSALNSTGKSKTYVAAVTIKAISNTKAKTMTLKWGKNSAATGYEIQYATNSKFTSSKKATVGKAATVTREIGSLVKGNTYYVRIRAYKTVGSAKEYSAWSAVKKVKISK